MMLQSIYAQTVCNTVYNMARQTALLLRVVAGLYVAL